MKIVIIANSSKGLFNFRQELIQKLLEKNEVVAVTPNNGSVDELESLGCKVIEISIDRRGLNPVKDYSLFGNYIKILKTEKPELVITYTIKPNIYGGIAARILKIQYTGNITGLGTAFQRKGLLKFLVIQLYKIAFKKAKVIFFENSENRDLFVDKKIIDVNKSCLLSGAGVNLNRFKVTEYPKGEIINFLFMGRIMKEKGIDELFSAMRMLIEDGYKVHLDILGEYEEEYQSVIGKYQKEGWLSYHGYQEDVTSFIMKSHCFVLPSWHEGMANTNLECAASGRPVITSNIHGCLEAVEDSVSGYLCDVKNSESLYKAMKKMADLSTEERCAMGLAGRKHMEDVFDKKLVVKETIESMM